MYAVDGGRHLPERDARPPAGLRGLRARCGSATARSTSGRRDVLGEVMIALRGRARRRRSTTTTDALGPAARPGRRPRRAPGSEPDNGLWEIRGPQRHFTHSRVMVWAAFDRAVRAVEEHGLDGPVDRWREVRDAGPRRGADARLRRRAQHLHPALRHRRGRRLAAGAARWSASSTGDDPQDARHHRGRSSRT